MSRLSTVFSPFVTAIIQFLSCSNLTICQASIQHAAANSYHTSLLAIYNTKEIQWTPELAVFFCCTMRWHCEDVHADWWWRWHKQLASLKEPRSKQWWSSFTHQQNWNNNRRQDIMKQTVQSSQAMVSA